LPSLHVYGTRSPPTKHVAPLAIMSVGQLVQGGLSRNLIYYMHLTTYVANNIIRNEMGS
jgi:hypothetical protein